MILGMSTATFTLAHVIISLLSPQSVCLPTGGVANVLQIARKDHHGEGADESRRTKEVHSPRPLLYPDNFSSYALDFTDVLSGVLWRKGITPRQGA